MKILEHNGVKYNADYIATFKNETEFISEESSFFVRDKDRKAKLKKLYDAYELSTK